MVIRILPKQQQKSNDSQGKYVETDSRLAVTGTVGGNGINNQWAGRFVG